MSKSRIFLWSLLAFIVGVGTRSFVAIPHALVAFFIATAAAGFALWFAKRPRIFALCGLLITAFALGIIRFDLAERAKPNLQPWYGKTIEAEGIIPYDPEIKERAQEFSLFITKVNRTPVARPFLSLISARLYPRYQIGDALRIRGALEEPINQDNFDYRAYLARNRIFSIISFPAIEKMGSEKMGFLGRVLSRTKHAFENNLDAALPEPHAAFAKGLLLGERSALPQKLIADFKKTGTTHIVALSGYNITIVGSVLNSLLVALGVSFFAAFWAASAGIILFVLMVGASASVARAAIMGILVLIAQREGRRYRITNALVFAGAIMIAHNPYLLRFDAAFQLSFLSTLGLIYLSPHIQNRTERMRVRVARAITGQRETLGLQSRRASDTDGLRKHTIKIQNILIETLAAQLMVLPLLVWLFGSISLISPVTNILVLVAVPYAMAGGFIAGLLGFIARPLGAIAGAITWLLLEYMIRVIEFFARIPGASLPLSKFALLPILIVYGAWALKKIHEQQKIRRVADVGTQKPDQ